MPAASVLLHLGVRHNLQCTYQQIRHVSVVGGQGLAWPRMGWESGKARVSGAKLAGLARVVPALTRVILRSGAEPEQIQQKESQEELCI